MSSITQAKAEAQKLIRRYNQLQAEAKTADATEAARKAAEADKLVSQISALQLAITKLQQQGREESTQNQAVPKTPAKKPTTATNKPKTVSTKDIQQAVSEKKKLEARMNRLEEAQKRTRTQIAQLTRAKDDLARLKRKAEQSVATIAKERSANDEKLQQELAKRIKKKEDEYKVLKRELELIRQQSQKDTELLKTQRDTARAIIERQKQEQATPQKKSNNGPLIIVGSVATISFILGIFLASLFASEKNTSAGDTSPMPTLTQSNSVVAPKINNYQKEIKPRETDRDRFKGLFGPKMIKLPAGTMKIIGKTQDDIKEVAFPSFSISKYEITFKEYDLFAIANNHELPETENKKRGMWPVTGVSWYDAENYTQWLSEQTGYKYQLPTEGEWEYAARAGADNPLEHFKPEQANCKECYAQWDGTPVQVKSFLPNPFLIYEMIGNVMEWTSSCYRSKLGEALAAQDNEGADCSKKIARGVHYMTPKKELEELRASKMGKREKLSPRTKRENVGFRVVRIDEE